MPQFNEIICSPGRLAVIATLIPGDQISFTALKRATGLADGNLHVQTRKLAVAGYIDIVKVSRGRRTITIFKVTELGIEQYKLHVKKLLSILDSESGTILPILAGDRQDDSQVWS
ncbi:MAG: transcriptional regulator [bacterium]|nr:transcriptional regulator [bacterium]MCP4798332.1 transcriptional regulator [bacterium]